MNWLRKYWKWIALGLGLVVLSAAASLLRQSAGSGADDDDLAGRGGSAVWQ